MSSLYKLCPISEGIFIILALTILGFGVSPTKSYPIDAFPDISPSQVKIILKSME